MGVRRRQILTQKMKAFLTTGGDQQQNGSYSELHDRGVIKQRGGMGF